jgi:antitoxin VapB
MALNIKNERVHALAREAAHLTGKTQTSVIEQALEELLARHSAERGEAERRDRVDRILAEFDKRLAGKPLMDHNDLYDPETGLPA